jgi:hypothetical protein
MPPIKTEIVQAVAPAYRLNDSLLDDILSALPPMTATAPPAWHAMRRERIRQEMAALRPTDAAQAMLAGQIVLCRHTAAHTMGLAARPDNTPKLARQLDRCAASLARTAKQVERSLRQRQKMVVPPGRAMGWEHIDMLALVAAWRGSARQIEGEVV